MISACMSRCESLGLYSEKEEEEEEKKKAFP
jgi:hypothetical protein